MIGTLIVRLRRPPPRFVMEVALVTIGMAAGLYFFYPGCMSGDSFFSWGEATHKQPPQFHDWHPPLVAYVWQLLNRLPFAFTPPYANLFVATNLLFWVGLALAVRPWFRHTRLWLAFFLCAGFFPPALGIVSQSIKDSLMCAALLAAYGGLLAAEREGSKPAFGFALFCLFLALGFRHNALLAVFPLALWAGFILCRNKPQHPRWKKICPGLVIFLALLGAVSGVNRLLSSHSNHPVQSLYTFDLVGISARTGHIYLPELYNDYRKQSLVHLWAGKGAKIDASPLTIDNIRKLYMRDTNMWIYFHGAGKGLRILDREEEILALRQAWLRAIREEPATYLKIRGDLYLTLLGLLPTNLWPYHCMTAPRHPGDPDLILPDFYRRIKGSWMFKGITYLSVIAGLLAVAYARRSLFPLHLIVLGVSALLYAGSYALIGVSADFRYLYWLIPVSLIMGINMAFITLRHVFPNRF